MAKPRILYITEEITPYLAENSNSLLGRELPVMSQNDGWEVRIFMPRFGSINERRNQLHEVIRLSGINIPIADTDHPLIIKVASMHPSRIQVYFIDNDDYFQRLDTDANPLGTNREDNDERAIFFTRGTLETVNKLRWEAQLVQCVGWMSTLSVMFLRRMYDGEAGSERPIIIFTLLPGDAPESIDASVVDKLREEGFSDSDMSELVADPANPQAFYRLAMRYADAIIVADPAATDLASYAASLGKPMMNIAPDPDTGLYNVDTFREFYKSLTNHDSK